ncbi:DUF5685 family protein [Amycolatopsis sp. NPDC001319]|uniref:DUF5685 family protein n=1 Tax=unclassified Amycolatopsis TaxID=2618356 RepID=UPI0036977523
MFGIIRPCRHRLSARLHADWLAHLCGLCLALRDEHGHLARVVTNYDSLVISALVEAQAAGRRRLAGPCALRGMRSASVARGEGAQLAAAVSLVLASAKVEDHVADGDGALGRGALRTPAKKLAARWSAQGARTGARIGFDTSVLVAAVSRQSALEDEVTAGDSLLLVTGPAEAAASAAFAQTAVLAGRPGNVAPLAEAGRLFGRVAHLLDAVEDQPADDAAGSWNPLTVTGTALAEARRLAVDAVLGAELAVRKASFAQPELVHALLVHELRQAVNRAFGHRQEPPPGWLGPGPVPPGVPPAPAGHPGWGPHSSAPSPPPPPKPPKKKRKPGEGPEDGDGGGCWVPRFAVPPRPRGFFEGCAVATYMCCSCQFCCRDPFPGPWSGKVRQNHCDCDPCVLLCTCCDGC